MDESLTSSVEEDVDDGSRLENVQHQRDIQKVKFQREVYRTATILGAVVGINLPLFILLLFVLVIESLVTPVPVVSTDPIGIQVGGNGTKVTSLANTIVVIEVLHQTVNLYRSGTPEIELVTLESENNG